MVLDVVVAAAGVALLVWGIMVMASPQSLVEVSRCIRETPVTRPRTRQLIPTPCRRTSNGVVL
ncbi:hypothetical protein JCM18918_1345 [Cutibacterium acnes JCM 18918]|nr:hypothetical protein JCM18918_1345 [Cutibacterium acnes JCM 18918]